MDPQPDFILTGGDAVHDLRAPSYADAQARLDAFLALWSATTRISTRHMIGNLEIAGFSRSEARESDPLFGKVLPLRAYGLEQSHRAYHHQGWRFLVLDNVQAP